jgi:hypothetical protein
MKTLRAWWLGVRDGWESPDDLSMGMTWPGDDPRNEAYDRGVNAGQFVGRLVARVRSSGRA